MSAVPAIPLRGDSAGDPRGMSEHVRAGAGWVGGAKLLGQAVQFAAGLVLARILSPADFGLLASVYVVTGFAVLFFEGGISVALVHLDDLCDDDLNTAFWLNLIGGFAFAALAALGGGLVASFFGQPILSVLTPIVALAFAVSFGMCQYALLERDLQYRTLAIVDLLGVIVSFSLAVALAFAGLGVYALAVAPVVQGLFSSVLLWRAQPWRPSGVITWTSVRRIWAFSGGLLGANVVSFWGKNTDNLLIGQQLGAPSLGYYSRGFNLMMLPVLQIGATLTRVLFPALSALQRDRPRMLGAFLRSLSVINLVVMPVLVGLAAVAPALVPVLWGDQWLATVPLLQILCLAGIPLTVSSTSQVIYQAVGATSSMFRVTLILTCVGVIPLVVGLGWGVAGVAAGFAIREWVLLYPALIVPARLLSARPVDLLGPAVRPFLIAATMGCAVWYLPVVLGLPRAGGLALLGQAVVGVVLYSLGTWLFNGRATDEVRVALASRAVRKGGVSR